MILSVCTHIHIHVYIYIYIHMCIYIYIILHTCDMCVCVVIIIYIYIHTLSYTLYCIILYISTIFISKKTIWCKRFPSGKAKSRAHALNRRISYTVDWDAMDVDWPGEGRKDGRNEEAEFWWLKSIINGNWYPNISMITGNNILISLWWMGIISQYLYDEWE